MITFTCPRCQQTFTASDRHAGEKFNCPGCGQRVRVPAPQSDPNELTPVVAVDETSTTSATSAWVKAAAGGGLGIAIVGALLFWLGFRGAIPPSQTDAQHQTAPTVTSAPVQQSQPAPSDLAVLAGSAFNLLKEHCHDCHGKDGAAEGGFNFVLDFERLRERKLVVPGLPDKSRLFRRVRNGEMPPEDVKTSLKVDGISLLKRWIEAGAPSVPEASPSVAVLSPRDVATLVHTDLTNLLPRNRRFARYFTIANLANAGLAGDELQTYRVGLAKLLNSLSWNADIVLPVAIDPNKLVFRVDIRDLSWSDRTWKQLLEEYPFAVSPADSKMDECIKFAEGQFPLLRVDWFVAHASRPPLYHAILQIPEVERKLEELVRIDVVENIRQERVVRVGFNGSGVSHNNRLIERHTTPYGAYWRSYDFESNAEQRNVFAFPLGPDSVRKGFIPSGGEIIFALPNGLHGFMLVDQDGKRLDKAPQQIVSDPKRPDRAVENGVSCMSCHARGLIPKADQIRLHVEKNPTSFDQGELEAIRAIYPGQQQVAAWFDKDNDRYRRAMAKVGPLTITEPISTLVIAFEKDLDLRAAASELGLRPDEVSDRLTKSPDLLRLLGPLRIAGGTVQREVFNHSFRSVVNEWNLGASVAVP